MKQISTLFFCLFISVANFAQPTYVKYFGVKSNNDFECSTMIPLPDGSVVALGNSMFNNHINKWDIDFVKLDPLGNVLVQKRLSTDYSSGDVKGISTSDGGFLLFVSEQELRSKSPKTQWGAALIKLKSNGDIEWSKYYNSINFRHIGTVAIIESKSGGYILHYVLGSDMYMTDNLGVMKVSSTGDVIWNTPLQAYLLWYWEYFGTSVLEASNGDIFISGYLRTEDPFVNDHSTIMRLSSNGKLQKSVYFHNPYQWGFRTFKLFEINNELVAYGDYTFTLNLNRTKYVTGTAMSFQYFLYRKYPFLKPQQFFGTCYFQDGSIIKVNRLNYGTIGGHDIGVSKYDSLYRICPDYNAIEVNMDTSKKKYLLSDLDVTTLNDSITISDIIVYDSTVNFVQTVCTGNVPPVLKSNLLLQEDLLQISIYPNPADNMLHVLNLKADEKYQLTIMNNLGNVFKQNAVENSSTYDFNLSGLKAGVYYLKVQSGKTNGSYMFIKK